MRIEVTALKHLLKGAKTIVYHDDLFSFLLEHGFDLTDAEREVLNKGGAINFNDNYTITKAEKT